MNKFSETYILNPGMSKVTITILSLDAYFQLPVLDSDADSSGLPKVQEFSWGQSGVETGVRYFTVHSEGEYVFALVKTEYPEESGITGPSYCHMYFKPQGSNWIWSTDAQATDNPTIFAIGQGQQKIETIAIQYPTKANPPGNPGGLPSLDAAVVFLLDINSTTNNLLFRGNEPLNTQLTNQSVDFAALHQILETQYTTQTGKSDFPAIGSYILRDIAFLDPAPADEGDILLAEISSFGASSTGQVKQTWYPEEVKPLADGMLGQVANWNVEPSGGSPLHPNLNLDVLMVQNLSEWMNTPMDYNGVAIPVVYYIHCSSGHDRTGIVSTGYLMQNYSLDLSTAFILGTTINKLAVNMGGNLIQDCIDVTSGKPDKYRSRCFVAGQTYNNTIQAMYAALTNTNESYSTDALSGDPAIGNAGQPTYVHSYYPWKNARNPITASVSEVL